jgi:NAD(P)-dependent dehydrogenase (short-subunit alcohol dehydrogenase family)
VFSLEGKVAIVTGCGSQSAGWGNGKAIAVLFARRGAAVYQPVEETAAQPEWSGSMLRATAAA